MEQEQQHFPPEELRVDYIIYKGAVNMSVFESHSFYEILYLFSGQRTMYMFNTQLPLNSDSIVIIPPGIPHKTISSSSTEQARVCLHIEPSFFQKLIPDDAEELQSVLTSFPLVLTLSPEKREFVSSQMRLLIDLFYSNEAVMMKPLKIQSAVLHLFMTLFAQIEPMYMSLSPTERKGLHHSEALFNEIVFYLQRNFRQDITLDSLSERFHMCKSRLSSLLNKNLGTSWTVYVNTLRVRDAMLTMNSSRSNISEIAASVGFGSLTHFERVFKQTIGKSPTQYIRELKETAEDA